MGLKPRRYPNRRARRNLLKYCVAYSMDPELATWSTGLSHLQVRRFSVGFLWRYRWFKRPMPSKAELLRRAQGRLKHRLVVDFETWPPHSMQWRVTDSYHSQLAAGAAIMQAEHDRLIAAGAKWDGMDGYDLT